MFSKTAIKETRIVCSTCRGTIPRGCTCYGGIWWQKTDGEWEWRENKDERKMWVSKPDPERREPVVRFEDDEKIKIR